MFAGRKALLAFALCAVVALSACGSESSDEGSGSTAPSGAASAESAGTRAPRGDPILIGLICGCTGPLASSLGDIPPLVEAWEKATNEAGGINGHPVDVIVKDDQANPSKAATAARQLVEEDVVAVVGSFSVTSEVYSPFFARSEVPQIGGSSSDLRAETSANYFPSGGNVAGRDYGVVKSARDAGQSRLAVFYCAEYPACASVGDLYSTIAEQVGDISVVTEGSMSATAPNYIPQCLKIKQSGADALYVSNGAPPVIKLLNDCLQQGVRVTAYAQAAVATPEMAKAPGAVGMQVMYGNPPASDTSTPGGRYLNESIDRYAAGLRETPNWNESLGSTWAALELFKIVGDDGRLTPESTTRDVYDALYEVRDETIDGLAPPLTFVEGEGRRINCWYSGTVEDERIVSNGSESECIPPEAAPAVEKARGL